MVSHQNVKKEVGEIFYVLQSKFSDIVDGKSAILEMKQKNMRNWRQMEWAGWYFEDVSRDELINKIGGGQGPTYGKTKFDYMRDYVWDLKMHSIYDKNGDEKPWLILNDKEAIEKVITDKGGMGFIIPNAKMSFDKTGQFKEWHDMLKGGKSPYEVERVKRGASSRMRKTSFAIKSWITLFFDDFLQIEEGMNQGWVGSFQKGMRNANGTPRREKVKINVDEVPEEHIILQC